MWTSTSLIKESYLHFYAHLPPPMLNPRRICLQVVNARKRVGENGEEYELELVLSQNTLPDKVYNVRPPSPLSEVTAKICSPIFAAPSLALVRHLLGIFHCL